jgi:hypothetical protein
VRKQIFRIFINHLKIDPHNLNNTLSRPEYRYEKNGSHSLKRGASACFFAYILAVNHVQRFTVARLNHFTLHD